ncbi:PNK3P-domain-containing protein [Violaceomyces palustris]|uniref:PNK3P-domain-containing protein n=1 Tax=Violaceomyces palustris TaxID=1673888 RepID=A0ACD0P3H5_9BASI|nr:PNK3P-domain-containing protein [Violaceomyces palustris]
MAKKKEVYGPSSGSETEVEEPVLQNCAPDPERSKSAKSKRDNEEAEIEAREAGEDHARETKKPKLASIFTKRAVNKPSAASGKQVSASGALVWKEPLGEEGSCLHGTFGIPTEGSGDGGSKMAVKSYVAAFDLDGTLIRPLKGKTFPNPKDEYDFEFVFPTVVEKLRKEHQAGATIIIVSNQKQSRTSAKGGLETWKKKLGHITEAIGVPIRVFAALAHDSFRKPALGSWHAFLELKEQGIEVDMSKSFYVGDAAGRKGSGRRVKDHSDGDLKWALNAGLRFYTPEHYFLGKEAPLPTPERHWLGEEEPSEPFYHPSDTPLVRADGAQEVVLFVGPPASGKTSLYKRYFEKDDYVWVNQDTLKSRDKCVKAVEKAIDEGKSCVVDNTNRDKATRKVYIDLARKKGVKIRCFHFNLTRERCIHNNLFRAFGAGPRDEPRRELVPTMAIDSFFKTLQTPEEVEGFDEEPKVIRWRFDGDEEVRRRYEMYYS